MRKTIIMSGGLGNQMFQYAFYLSMKSKGIDCRIDDTLFYTAKMHNGFELDRVFSIPERLNKPSRLKKIWIQILRKNKPALFLLTDRRYQFTPEAYDAKQPYLMGDWLSPSYFKDIEDVVREHFNFKSISKKNIETSKIMQSCNSVSIHIRRGDYLNLPNYCVCDEEYYRCAIKHICENVDKPVFYVFSNEPDWCESFMQQFGVVFKIINWNQRGDSYQDMYLMTQCKHNIIANSTFSWWGAWLNNKADNIVVAPHVWFKNNNYNINCPGWHLI